jgi:protein SCO1/2
MNNYIRFFSPAFVGLTGEQAQIDLLTKTLGVPVEIHDLGNGAYTVDHAATLFLLDPQARMTAVFSPPHTVATLSTDLRNTISQLKS